MRFATPAEAVEALRAKFGPDDHDWRLAPGALRLEAKAPGGLAHIKRFHGALLRTMHFGLVTLDLENGTVEFVDEDHRDGGDLVCAQATLPADWHAALRAVAWPG